MVLSDVGDSKLQFQPLLAIGVPSMQGWKKPNISKLHPHSTVATVARVFSSCLPSEPWNSYSFGDTLLMTTMWPLPMGRVPIAHFILLVSLGAYRVFLDSWVLYVLTPHHEVPRPQYQIVVAQSFPTRGIIPTMGHCARGRGTEQWHCNWGVYCIFATLLSSPSLLFNRAACSLIFFMNFRKGGGGSIPIQRNVGNFPVLMNKIAWTRFVVVYCERRCGFMRSE